MDNGRGRAKHTHEEENMDRMSLLFKRCNDLNQKMALPAVTPHALLGAALLDPSHTSPSPYLLWENDNLPSSLQPHNSGLTYLDSVQALSERLSSLGKQWMMFQTEPAQG